MEGAKADEKLQMLFDGELSPEEEAELRRELAGSAEATAELRQWATMREALADVSADWSGELDSNALFARIEAEIEPGAAVDERPAADDTAPVELRVVPGGRERRIWGGLATGLAAAAAIFLAVIAWPEEQGSPSLEMARGTEVVEVDFGANAGTVFEVEGGAGQPLAVIWIDDEEAGMP
jgi:negative regulator of sigma E activity